MKKTFTILIALLLVPFITCKAQSPTNPSGDGFPIGINPTIPNIPPIRPLSLTESDIEAEYYNGVVSFWFNTDLGVADIIITNTSTGESWVESMNGTGATIVMLNNTPGYYVINIYTDNGDYYGEFFVE